MNDSNPTPPAETRRLAAVVFTDVVGYSARMQRDEASTIALVDADFVRMHALCAEHGGDALNSMGDGLMLCFPSAVQAVTFALEVQREFGARKSSAPEGAFLEHRVGVHLGDVIVQKSGVVAGDGVNIAARLEGKAPVGGICISQTVYDTVKGKVAMQATFIGPEQFKNIAEPIPVWHVSTAGEGGALVSKVAAKARKQKSKHWLIVLSLVVLAAIVSAVLWKMGYTPMQRGTGYAQTGDAAANASALSIMVLPFANQTGDPQKAYIADALTTSITSDLSRIRDAFVIPPTTAAVYKDKPAAAQQVGKDLGVRFVLQGSVVSSGDKARISATLADTQTGAQLWSDTFDGELTNLFALQDQVTTRIGASIGREMVIVAARESETRKSSPKMADLIMRSRALRLKPQSLKNWQEIESLSRQALELEPDNAGAMADLAQSLVLQARNFGAGMDKTLREKKYVEGRDVAVKARELDPDNPGIYTALGFYAGSHDDFAGYRRAFETFLSLHPKSPIAYNNLALTYIDAGDPNKAIELLNQAISLDPKHPAEVILINMGRAYFMRGDTDAAITWYQRGLEKVPGYASVYVDLAMAYAVKGDAAKAQAAAAELRRLDPNIKLSSYEKPRTSFPPAGRDWFQNKYVPAWRKAGLPE